MTKFYKSVLIIAIVFSLPIVASSQQVRVTWPINGMIFQQDINGNATVEMVLQAGYGWQNNNDTQRLFYNIQKLKTNGECQTVDVHGFCSSYVFSTWQQPASTSWISQSVDWKIAKVTLPPLPTGWYRLKIAYPSLLALNIFEVKFGVGDNYIVAGQSNASGFCGINVDEFVEESNQGIITLKSNYSGIDIDKQQQDAVRNISIPAADYTILYNQNIKGIPLKSRFSKLESSNNAKGIYPNGRDSWYWAPFANKVAKKAKTPVMIYNVASPNTSAYDWANNENTQYNQKLRSTLQMYGLLGLKAVLWYQGENDVTGYSWSKSMDNPMPNPNYLSEFKTYLTNLIGWSRTATTPNLSWYFSKVSFTNAGDLIGKWSGEPNLNNYAVNCLPLRPDLKYTMTSPLGIGAKQIEVFNNSLSDNIFEGVTSDLISECYRAEWQRIHFSGSSNTPQDGLNAMADAWYNAIFNNDGTYKNSSPTISSKPLLDISVSKDGSNNYVLHAPLKSNNTEYLHYFWVIDDNGIYNPISTDREFSTNKNNSSSPEFYICYVSDQEDSDGATNGWNLNDLQATSPFVMKNTQDATTLYIFPEEFNIPVSQYSIVKNYNVAIQPNDVTNIPNWVTVTGYGTNSITLTADFNNNARRSGELTITPNEFPTTQNIITINQASAGSNCQVYLSSLIPLSAVQDFGTLKNNLSAGGNQLNIDGTTYDYGLGTHANSNIKYNLGGNYLRFQAYIGRDNEVNGCVCGNTQEQQFLVKVDGITVYASGIFGFNAPIFVDIPVEDAQTLELIVDKAGDNLGDHVDWADAKLLCINVPCFNSSALSSPTEDYNSGVYIQNVNANTGTITATNKITGSADLSLYGGRSITLYPGFKADNGTLFKAEIGGCY